MSTIPQAKSQVSESPAKMTVARAMDPKAKREDVDRKMRFYGVLQAFREGRYPDNQQIDDALKYTIANSPIPEKNLSKDGQRLVTDVRELIETARKIVKEKNSNEEIQRFLFASRKAQVADRVGVKAPVSKEAAKKDADSAGEAFRTLGKLLLRNGEFRKLFQDFATIGRDVFADAASKGAELARPDEDSLAKVDQPAPDNHFHDDIPQAFRKAQEVGEQAQQLGQEAQAQANSTSKEEAAQIAQQEANKVVDPNASLSANAKNVGGALKANTFDKLPEKHRDAINEHAEKAKNYAKDKFPEERREQFIYRLKKVVVECQRHREYQDAIEFFLSAFEHYKGHAGTVATQLEGSAVDARNESNVQTAEQTFRTLIERFANGKSSQPMLDALDQIYTDVKNDPELKAWFSDLDKFVRNCLQTPGYIMKDESDRHARQLVESGKKFFVAADGREQGKYVPHKNKLFDEVETFFLAFGDDPLNKKFGDDWKRLFQHLVLNDNGQPTFKPDLWRDIQSPILPELAQHIGYVPIPRIEYSDKQVDLVIENLTIEAQNLLPNVIQIDNFNHVKLSAYKNIANVNKHTVKLTLSGMQTDMRDIKFAIKRKSGFPKINETGTADVFVGGKGLTVAAEIEVESVAGRRRRNAFKVRHVKSNVDQLKFAVRHSSHDLLVKLLRPLATGLIKKQIAKAIERAIEEGLEKANSELTALLNELDAAKADPERKQIDVLKEKAQKAEDNKDKAKPEGTFKVVTSKRDSILPQMGATDGWVKKIDERTEAAKAGKAGKPEWHSPAFTIVPPGQPEPKGVGNLAPPVDFKDLPAANGGTSITGKLEGVKGNITTATGSVGNGAANGHAVAAN